MGVSTVLHLFNFKIKYREDINYEIINFYKVILLKIEQKRDLYG